MKTIILGGGTFSPIANHLALSAPAFGTTARVLAKMIPNSELVLTKMADISSNLITNDDVAKYIDGLLEDKTVKGIILNIAFCDYIVTDGDFHANRFKTEDGVKTITLTPAEKVISKIRIKRPDIFLVGFKTTTNYDVNSQFLTGLKMMKTSKCNLVLANDTVTRNNIIITPEETYYGDTTNRDDILNDLVEIYNSRLSATYNNTIHKSMADIPMTSTSNTFQKVIQFLIDNGGFIENNGNGFTPGHFCERVGNNFFVSSQRKANHNDVFTNGLSLVEVQQDTEDFIVYGTKKASVGARSQWLLLKQNSDFNCIIHTHNPLNPKSRIPITEQKPYQCGSLECGLNTLNNLGDFGEIKAVYLNKHGANILFKSATDPNKIIDFIKENLILGVKTI